MGAKAESWQRAEIAGPKKALLILKPLVVTAMVKRSKRPILIVGHHALEDYSQEIRAVDYAIQISRAAKIPFVATAHTTKELLRRKFKPAAFMPAVDIANRLGDSAWKGLDGKGSYDLGLFLGLPYYMGFVILAGLKHFSPNLKTISLDRFYTPNATWSFPNLKVQDWKENMEVIIKNLRGR
jgi:acetyl-CoA decarbonylase/synthase complex subunit epsilon